MMCSLHEEKSTPSAPVGASLPSGPFSPTTIQTVELLREDMNYGIAARIYQMILCS
jgi:hypothetical protein